VAGLVAGIALPDLAAALKPWLPEMVAFLLFIAALRIGPRAALGRLRDFGTVLKLTAAYQIALPVILFLSFGAVGFSGPLAFAVVLMASASSISGSANLTLLTGNDPAPALRLMVVGTALLPLTVLPVLWLVPEIGSAQAVFGASGRLLLIILVAAVAAFVLRHLFLQTPSEKALAAIDGTSAIAMAVVVIGLMSAMGPALRTDPVLLATTLAAAFAANFGLQITAWLVLANVHNAGDRPALSIVAGNRNMALFLAALPAATTDPILLFIGCYQIPMYLTPILLGRLYATRDS